MTPGGPPGQLTRGRARPGASSSARLCQAARVAGPGELDVDARFLLANERTLLAWVRTSLTLLAAGVGTLQLLEERWRAGPGLAMLVLGAAGGHTGALRRRDRDRRRLPRQRRLGLHARRRDGPGRRVDPAVTGTGRLVPVGADGPTAR